MPSTAAPPSTGPDPSSRSLSGAGGSGRTASTTTSRSQPMTTRTRQESGRVRSRGCLRPTARLPPPLHRADLTAASATVLQALSLLTGAFAEGDILLNVNTPARSWNRQFRTTGLGLMFYRDQLQVLESPRCGRKRQTHKLLLLHPRTTWHPECGGSHTLRDVCIGRPEGYRPRALLPSPTDAGRTVFLP